MFSKVVLNIYINFTPQSWLINIVCRFMVFIDFKFYQFAALMDTKMASLFLCACVFVCLHVCVGHCHIGIQ